MSARPFVANVVIYPLDKMHAPFPATISGTAYDPSLGIWGGPIVPGEQPPSGGPPGQPIHPIWGPPGITLPPGPGYPPVAGHPLPIPPMPPDLPPNPSEPKPPPPEGGWGWHPTYGWGYFPGGGGKPQPPGR